MTENPYAEAFAESLQQLAAEVNMPEEEVRALAGQLADRSITDQDSEQQIMVLRAVDGQVVSAKYFSPLAAVGVLASLTGTLLAPATPVSLGLGVLGAFIALLGTSEGVTAPEAALFWLLTDLVRPVRSEFLRKVYVQECTEDHRVSEASYESALNGLLKLRCVREDPPGSYNIRGRWIVVPL